MPDSGPVTLSYFPGCSLATTARENNASLTAFLERLGIELVELEDWNCCGSSSLHSLDAEAAFLLPARNLSLAPAGRPLLIACPSCMLRMRQAQLRLAADPDARARYREHFGREADLDLEVVHFFEVIERSAPRLVSTLGPEPLKGVRFAPYYGCMLARPPSMRHEKNYHGLLERILTRLGAAVVAWPFAARCCGTFLTAARPEVVIPLVNRIVDGARAAGANCIVTACAMCHMNLESRCTSRRPVPVLHFSEALALAMGVDNGAVAAWLARHLIDPRPLFKELNLIA
jgi:heterodisulfide reductase subunit B